MSPCTRMLSIFCCCSLALQITAPATSQASPLKPILEGVHMAFELKSFVDDLKLMSQVSPACSEDLLYMLDPSRTSHSSTIDWQKQMLDSNGKMPAGILEGNIFWMGDFTQCTSIEVWKTQRGNGGGPQTGRLSDFKGKHCLSTYDDFFLHDREFAEDLPMLTSTGICVPSTCTAEETKIIVNQRIWIPNMAAETGEEHCQTNENKPMDWIAIFVLLVGGLLGSVVVVSTIYDVTNTMMMTKTLANSPIKYKKRWQKLLVSFSAYSNTRHLLDTTSSSKEGIACFNGIRIISQCLIMLHHVDMFSFVSNGKHNPAEHGSHLKELHWQMLTYGVYAVDAFFFMTGFLLAKEVDRLSLRSFCVNRLWRITPMYVAVMALMTGPFVFAGRGPLWFNQMLYNRKDCLRTWWRHLLYIDIWFHQSKCMGHAWYLNVDMLCYLLSPIIIYPFAKNRRTGIRIWTSVVIFCYAFTALAIDHNDVLTIPTTKHFSDHMGTMVKYTATVHTKPWARVHPILMGMPIGYLYYNKRNTLKFSKVMVTVGWMTAIASMTIVLGILYAATDKDPPRWVFILFGTFNHTVFTIGVAWIIMACATGHAGVVNSILSWKLFVPLARLSFGTYLLQYVVLVHLQATNHHNLYVDFKYVLFSFTAVLTVTTFLSWLLYIMVDAPTVSIKRILSSASRDQARSSSTMSDQKNGKQIFEKV